MLRTGDWASANDVAVMSNEAAASMNAMRRIILRLLHTLPADPPQGAWFCLYNYSRVADNEQAGFQSFNRDGS